jgi:corrinoid protein of di/trimethylamine methyltransferase
MISLRIWGNEVRTLCEPVTVNVDDLALCHWETGKAQGRMKRKPGYPVLMNLFVLRESSSNAKKGMEGCMADMEKLSEFLQRGRAKEVKELTQLALDDGMGPQEILEQGLLAGMNVVGVKFKNNEVFVPEVLIAARAMNAGMEILKPHLITANVQDKGTVVIGTVKGDLHDIGKNLVSMMLKGKGLKVVDLGSDVSPQRFVDEAKANNAKVIACSALLTTTMREMEQVVKAVNEAGLRDKVKIMVGGAPVTDAFCKSIGADKYTPDATTAAEAALAYCIA